MIKMQPVARCSGCKDNCIPIIHVKVFDGWEALVCPHCHEITRYHPATQESTEKLGIMKQVYIEIQNLEREGSLAVDYLQHEITRLSNENANLRINNVALKRRIEQL